MAVIIVSNDYRVSVNQIHFRKQCTNLGAILFIHILILVDLHVTSAHFGHTDQEKNSD